MQPLKSNQTYVSNVEELHTHLVNSKKGCYSDWSRTFALKTKTDRVVFVQLNLFHRMYANIAGCWEGIQGYFKKTYVKFEVVRCLSESEIDCIIYNTSRDLLLQKGEDGQSTFDKLHADIEAQTTLWRGHLQIDFPAHAELGGKMARREWWGRFAERGVCSTVDLRLSTFSNDSEGIALDIGCGNSTVALFLLQKNWKVICLDYSEKALNAAKNFMNKINDKWVESGQLTFVHADIAKYKWTHSFNVIVAGSVLPYINPRDIKQVINNIHAHLKPGGHFIGNFFGAQYISEPVAAVEKEMGAWFIEGNSNTKVGQLLAGHHFDVLVCTHGGKANLYSTIFVGKKVAQVAASTATAAAPRDKDHKS